MGVLFHPDHMVGAETLEDLRPTTCFLKYLYPPSSEKLIKNKSIRQLAVRVILWKH